MTAPTRRVIHLPVGAVFHAQNRSGPYDPTSTTPWKRCQPTSPAVRVTGTAATPVVARLKLAAGERERAPDRTPEPHINAALARVLVAAVVLPLLVAPAPAAAHVAPTEPAAVFAPVEPAGSRVAAERAARTLNRRMAPPVEAVAVQPLVRKPVKPAIKKPAVKKAAPKTRPKLKTTVEPKPVKASGGASTIVQFALSIVGRPYVYGASGPSGYDCSGVVVAAGRRVGVRLPHKAAAFYGVGRAVPYSQIQPGDIIVMNGGKHAGIALGGGKMVHAPSPGRRVEIAPIWKFSAARRIV